MQNWNLWKLQMRRKCPLARATDIQGSLTYSVQAERSMSRGPSEFSIRRRQDCCNKMATWLASGARNVNVELDHLWAVYNKNLSRQPRPNNLQRTYQQRVLIVWLLHLPNAAKPMSGFSKSVWVIAITYTLLHTLENQIMGFAALGRCNSHTV